MFERYKDARTQWIIERFRKRQVTQIGCDVTTATASSESKLYIPHMIDITGRMHKEQVRSRKALPHLGPLFLCGDKRDGFSRR